MADSILKDSKGPDWPLGFVKVLTPGTPVNLMARVDPTSQFSPGQATDATHKQQYSVGVQQIIFQAKMPDSDNGGLKKTTGRIYVTRVPVGGAGGRSDYGCIVATLEAGESFVLSSYSGNIFSPYRYYIDADTANEGAMVTLVIV